MRATIQQDSKGILRKQSEKKSHVRLRSHLSEETRLKLTESRAIEIASLWMWSSRAIEIASLLRNKAQAYRVTCNWDRISLNVILRNNFLSGRNPWVRRWVQCNWDCISPYADNENSDLWLSLRRVKLHYLFNKITTPLPLWKSAEIFPVSATIVLENT